MEAYFSWLPRELGGESRRFRKINKELSQIANAPYFFSQYYFSHSPYESADS